MNCGFLLQMEDVVMRVKIFSMNNPMGKRGRNQQALEDQINEWLSENEVVEIIRVEQSASGGSFDASLWMISVWYNPVESQ